MAEEAAENVPVPPPLPWHGNLHLIRYLEHILDEFLAARRPRHIEDLEPLHDPFDLLRWAPIPQFEMERELFLELHHQGLDHHLDNENFDLEDIFEDQEILLNRQMEMDYWEDEEEELELPEFEEEDEMDMVFFIEEEDDEDVDDEEIPDEPF
ncbi:hypothetical protein L5515_002647 [Caenorhabditis briggsae]|uniref:Uncharacterized protein n=1 Tax=Caenorhabditis briggsae TaxID=6238 RepID=A0AAE9E994_CAEBR|nr:hypothetical protein L5515_002647 [Caenorhabditis briggsae]